MTSFLTALEWQLLPNYVHKASTDLNETSLEHEFKLKPNTVVM